MIMKHIYKVLFLMAMISPNIVISAPITVLPVNSFTIDFVSEIPVGMDISITTYHNESTTATDIRQPLGSFNVYLNGVVETDTQIEFITTFDFGEDVGVVSFNDSFILQHVDYATTGSTGRFVYLGDVKGGFYFGETGFATIGQPGYVFASLFFGENGGVVEMSYELSVSSLDTSAVPVPAAIWLFSSGLLGLIGFSRKS